MCSNIYFFSISNPWNDAVPEEPFDSYFASVSVPQHNIILQFRRKQITDSTEVARSKQKKSRCQQFIGD